MEIIVLNFKNVEIEVNWVFDFFRDVKMEQSKSGARATGTATVIHGCFAGEKRFTSLTNLHSRKLSLATVWKDSARSCMNVEQNGVFHNTATANLSNRRHPMKYLSKQSKLNPILFLMAISNRFVTLLFTFFNYLTLICQFLINVKIKKIVID